MGYLEPYDNSGWDVAQLVRASDRHAADTGSIPRCGTGFSSQSQLSMQTFFRCPYTSVCNRMINICVHDNGPVVHVWTMAIQTYPARTISDNNNQHDDCGRSAGQRIEEEEEY